MNAIRDVSRAALRGAFATMAAGLFLTACSAPPATEQAAAPSPPPAPTLNLSYNELMVTWIDNASHVLWDAEKQGFAPKNAADWTEIEDHATQLAAAGTLIQLPGTGTGDLKWSGEEGWKTNARLMSEAGQSARAAARSQSLPALIEANSKLVQTCEGCHKQFKPDLPSEGIAHQRPHSDSHAAN
jgi:hypothetical protein